MILVGTLSILFLSWVNLGYGKTALWCFGKPKVYQQTMALTQQFCRPVRVQQSITRPGHPLNIIGRRPLIPPKRRIIDEEKAAHEVMKAYPGLFMTEISAKKIAKEKKIIITDKQGRFIPSIRPIKPAPSHDEDIHCPTYQQLTKAPDSLRSVQGKQRSIVHFENAGVFQFIQKGMCGGPADQACGGSCLQETSITYLMVWNDNPDWPMGFEPFQIEAYCSCKNAVSHRLPLVEDSKI